jgi:chloride channel 7
MGVCAFAVDVALETLNTWKFAAVRAAVRAGEGFWAPYAVFMAFCLAYAGAGGALVAFGAPLAAGSGSPEIKTYLNGVHIRGAAPSLAQRGVSPGVMWRHFVILCQSAQPGES